MRLERWLFTIPLRLRSLFRWVQADQELEDELRDHLERKTEEYAAKGMAPEEARRRARLDLGGLEKVKEECRDARSVNWIQDLFQDLRFGLRMLRKNPGFATVAVLTLALGIGANTAIFSVVNGVLLRRLPYSDPDQLVWAAEYWPRINDDVVPDPDYTNWKLNNHHFEGLAAFDGGDHINMTGAGQPERIESVLVTANFVSVLGVGPSLGRGFLPQEAEPGGKLVAILSDALWKREFGAEQQILGKEIALNGQLYTVVGVMPAGFRFPDRRPNPEIFLPFQLPKKVDWNVGRVSLTRVIGRLKSGVSIAQGNAELAGLSKQTEKDIPANFVHARDGMVVRVADLHEKLVGDTRPTLLILLAAVGFVLLIGCVNVANLQLARAAGRQKELAVRAAIGAGRARLLSQLLTEAGLLAALGAVLGLLIAMAGMRVLRDYAPTSLVQVGEIALDRWVLLFAFGITLFTAALFGTFPALRASNPDVNIDLKGARLWVFRGLGEGKVRAVLVTCELMFALALLAASGLLIRSLVLLSNVDPGFDPTNLLTVSTALPESKYAQPEQRIAFFGRVLRRIVELPGVRSAALTTSLPLTKYVRGAALAIEGEPSSASGLRPLVPMEHVSRDYFSTLKVPLREGRVFEEGDFTPQAEVLIVNRAFVRRYCPNEDVVGKRIRLGGMNAPWKTIVGAVGDVRHTSLNHEAEPEVYVPYAGEDTPSTVMLAVRIDADPRSLVAAVRDAVIAVDAEQPIFAATTMEQRVADAALGTRFNATLLSLFGFAALALTAVGVYGVVAYSVAERTREIGIRVALGATPRDVAGMVMSQGMAMTGVGIVLGFIGAFFVTRILAGLLYGIRPGDPLTLVGAATILGLVALAACYLPTRRAMRVDPMVALRYE
jgi:putative ABC transport system permease protein